MRRSFSVSIADFLSHLGKWVKLIKFEAEQEIFGLNPNYPRGGTLCPPCYVFAYICANTRTSPLKKLDFSQL